jgi:IclR family transcriptional regulator, KDG regulon repressor
MTILEAVAAQPMRAKGIASELGLPWTTAYRTIAYLEEHGFLIHDRRTGEYAIGPRTYQLGSAYLVRHDLAIVAPSHLRVAADAMKCGAQANEALGHTVITVATIDPPLAIPMTSAGFTFPMGVAAKGQLLLAYATPEVQEEVLSQSLPRFTRHTISDPAVLRARLEKIHAEGFAVTQDDIQIGVSSVAAPVRNVDGDVIGCVSLVMRTAQMKADGVMSELIHVTTEAASSVSMALGWRPNPLTA